MARLGFTPGGRFGWTASAKNFVASSLVSHTRALCVEHSTVGRRLSALEETLGAALVSRGGEGLRLTALYKPRIRSG